jgi:prevent-host-death family protein
MSTVDTSTVGVRELKRDLSGYLKRAAAGEPIRVTVRGKPVVELRAIAEDAPEVDPWEVEKARLIAEGTLSPATRPKRAGGYRDLPQLDFSPTDRLMRERAEEDVELGLPPRWPLD